jgi:lysophospholipase L1-like esterase
MLDGSFGENRIEVVNAGVPGYSSAQILRYLKEDILKYDPDLLIVQYGENDEEGANNREQSPSPVFFHLRPFLLKARLFQAGYGLYYGIRKCCYDYNKTYRERISLQSYKDCLDNLAEIEKCARDNGVAVFFITPAWFVDGRLLRMAPFAKSPPIDIFTELNESGVSPFSLYFDIHHWFPAGHSLVASAVYKAVYPTVLSGLPERGK